MYGKRGDITVHKEEPFNCEPPRTALAAAEITATDTFYVRNHGPIPAITEPRVRVDGLVVRELDVSLDDLRRFPERELVVTLQCAGNRRADLMAVRDIPGEEPWGPCATGTARWRGVALADVLAEAGPTEQARHVG